MLHFQHDQIKKQKERNPEAKKMDEQVAGGYVYYVANADSVMNLIFFLFD